MRSDRSAIMVAAGLATALSVAIPTSIAAQTANEDVRCLLLSGGYARQAKEEGSRRAAAMTGAFYLGRLTGRLSDDALAAAIRAQGGQAPSQQAEPQMLACAARAAAAEKQMAATVGKVQARPKQ